MTNAAYLDGAGDERPLALPGFLFAPFGWAIDWLAAAVEAEPPLLAEIYPLSRRRMHLIALALAHLDPGVDQRISHLLLRGSEHEILERFLGRKPNGLKRALNNLQPHVLSPDGYRRLVDLLDDPASAKALSHAVLIDDDDLKALADIPVALRPAAIPMTKSTRLSGLADGLQLLVSRGAASSFEALIADLQPLRQPPQLSAHIRGLVEGLPLPAQMPPPRVGLARRLDRPAEIRDLSKQWRNCLDKLYLSAIDAGISAIYLWDDPQAPAACAVERHGRLGWFLAEVKGPRNTDLKPDRLCHIQQRFADVGILRDAVAVPILNIIAVGRDGRRSSGRLMA